MIPRAAAVVSALVLSLFLGAPSVDAAPIRVITTSSSYAPIVRYIGGEQVTVSYIVKGYQDPHIVRPKPSLAVELKQADLLIATGLDLEAWLPALQDMAGNARIMSGQPGYVSVSAGLSIAEKPTSLDRSEGDVHVFGNPHIHTSPLSGKVIAENIAVGLSRVAPEHAATFKANLKRFKAEIDERLFGAELVRILGGKKLSALAQKGKLHDFLERKSYRGQKLIARLGGWMKQALPLKGRKIVCYHKNWTYFTQLFGLHVAAYLEPKPGIPPSPGHVASLIETMRRDQIKVVLAANYFDQGKVRRVTEKTGARPIVVALAVDGQEGMDTYFSQFDIWIGSLVEAFSAADG